MTGCAAVIYKLSIWPEYFSALHWPLLCTRCTNSILLSAPAAQKSWHGSSKSKAGLLNSNTEKLLSLYIATALTAKSSSTVGSLEHCMIAQKFWLGASLCLRIQWMLPNNSCMHLPTQWGSCRPACHIVVPRRDKFLNQCLCARPACVAKSGPLVQALKNKVEVRC